MPRHPVSAILAEAAYAGRELTEEELAGLELDAADRELVRKAAREAAFIRAGGEGGRANEHALRRSHEIIAVLPEAQRDPRYLHEPDNLDGLGPAELAARIPR
jgi:hypothetical protein